MNAAEDRLSELMDAATRALAPPLDAILAEGERLGRSRRRRRRAAVATGTAAMLVVAGAGAAAGLRLTRDAHSTAAAAPVVQRVSRAPTAIAPSPSPTVTAPQLAAAPTASPALTVAVEPLTAANAVIILQTILKTMKPVGATGWRYSSHPPSKGSLLNIDVDDGKGLARVFVSVGPVADAGVDPIDCAQQSSLLKGGGARPPGAPAPSCVVRKYPNGDMVMQEVLIADPYGEYQYRVVAVRADGIAVDITAANGDGTSPKTAVTRTAPPLSIAQWTAIALDRTWQLKVLVNLAGASPTP